MSPRKIKPLDQAIAAVKEAVANGVGVPELEAEIEAQAERHGVNQQTLRKVAEGQAQRLESVGGLETAAAALRDELDRRDLEAQLSLDQLLPARAAEAVETLTRYLPTTPLASTLLLLTGISGVLKIGNYAIACPASGFRQPLSLFSGLVASSGQKKSPLLRALVRDRLRLVRIDVADGYRNELEVWEKQRDHAREEKQDPPPRPRRPLVMATQYTSEGLLARLVSNENRRYGALVAPDELDGLFQAENAYRGGRGGDETLLLELYDGSPQEIVRRNEDNDLALGRCHVSVLGTIQPEVLRERVRKGDARGKWARFIFVSLPRRVVPLLEVLDDRAAEAYEQAADALDHIYLTAHKMEPRCYRLDPEARQTFIAYEARCQREALAETDDSPVQPLRAKGAGKVLRLSGILHVLAIAAGEASGDLIGAQLVDTAITIVDLTDGWTAGLHRRIGDSDAGAPDELMRKIHQLALKANGPIAAREVLPKLSKKQRKGIDAEVIAAAMTQLAQLGVGVVEVSEQGAHSFRSTAPLAA